MNRKNNKMLNIIIISIIGLIISQWLLGKLFFSLSSYFGTSYEELYSTKITSEEKKIIDDFNKLQKTNTTETELVGFLKSNVKKFSKFTSCNLLHSYEKYQLCQLNSLYNNLNNNVNKNELLTYIQIEGNLENNPKPLKEVYFSKIKSIDNSNLKDNLQSLKDNGYKLIYNGTSFIPLINFSFYENTFSPYMDDYTKDYFKLMVEEQDFNMNLQYTSNIQCYHIQDIILSFENYLKEDPGSFKDNELREKYCKYIKLYTLGSQKFSVYNKSNILLPELKESYKKLLSSPKSSKLKDIIENLIEILDTSNYSLNNKVEDYVLDTIRQILH